MRLRLLTPALAWLICASAQGASAQYQAVPLPFWGSDQDTSSQTEAIAVDDHSRVVVSGYQPDAGIWGDRCTRHKCVRVPALWEIGLGAVAGINANGTVVASSPQVVFTPDRIETYHGYLYRRNGSFKIVYGFAEDECDGCTLYSYAYAANSSEAVVGVAEGADGRRHAAIWASGTPKDLGTLGGEFSKAVDINELGTVIGQSDDAGGSTRSFITDGDVLRDLGTLGGPSTHAFKINNVGVIVGCSTTAAGTTTAFRISGSDMQPLPMVPGSAESCALAINDAGQTVGWFNLATAPDKTKAFLFDGTTTADLNSLLTKASRSDWQVVAASGINEKGEIAATGRNKKYGTIRALLLVPVSP